MSKKNVPNKYLLIHTHKFGASHTIFEAVDFKPMKFTNNDQIKALVKACGLDYDPEQGEEITLFHEYGKVLTLTKADLKE